MQKQTRGWNAKRRKEQAERLKARKPWEKSTGPKTDTGKAACARNAYKHGFRSRDMAEIRALLNAQEALVKQVLSAFNDQDRGL